MASVSPGQSYTISGVRVQFPCRPYPSQMAMMGGILKGLERKQNCLMESPTGSGKSLALLCSALAWQTAEYAKQKEEYAQREQEETGEKPPGCTCGPKAAEACSEQVAPPTGNNCNSTSPGCSVNYLADKSICEQNESMNRTGPQKAEEAEDEDDDFKAPAKRFRTPGSAQPTKKPTRPHLSVSYEADSGSPCTSRAAAPPDGPRWKMELTGSHALSSAAGLAQAEKGDSKECATAGPCCSCKMAASAAGVEVRKVPKIFFGTRTHKQIAQITRELGKTAYRGAKMVILASREHTCIHPAVSRGAAKNEKCKELLENAGCRYHERVKTKMNRQWQLADYGLDSAWDLEDFVGVCQKVKACPYFASRELMLGADVIFCPYNYLIERKIRISMDLSLKDHIVILDEAHNIEDCARDAGGINITKKLLEEATYDLHKMVEASIKPLEHGAMSDVTSGLMRLIDRECEGLNTRGYDQAQKIWSGMDMLAQLNSIGLANNKYEALMKSFVTCLEDIPEQKKNESAKLHSSTLSLLEGVLMMLEFLYKKDQKYMMDYRLALVRTQVYVDASAEGQWLDARRGPRYRTEFSFTLHFWCLNPAVAFTDFGEDTRSIVLTSGTLSPMDSFQSELGLAFPITLEANHVINRKQVWVGTVGTGPGGEQLQASYKYQNTFSFQDQLGQLVLDVCKKVPFGVLCFLPSYKLMETLTNRWKQTGLWGQLEDLKVVMKEPRASDKADFDQLMKNFYEVIEMSVAEPENGGQTGGLFFAVCRGKVSEGLDFADNNARAVITVGIPYPNFKDAQVELKRNYNDQNSRERGLLTGSQWYEIQAYRALNQALGRCIRHRYDWGAILLVDHRFVAAPVKYNKGLSKWVRREVRTFNSYRDAMHSIDTFTKERMAIDAAKDENNGTNMTINTSPSQANSSLLCKTPGGPIISPPPATPETPIGQTLKPLHTGGNMVNTSTPIPKPEKGAKAPFSDDEEVGEEDSDMTPIAGKPGRNYRKPRQPRGMRNAKRKGLITGTPINSFFRPASQVKKEVIDVTSDMNSNSTKLPVGGSTIPAQNVESDVNISFTIPPPVDGSTGHATPAKKLQSDVNTSFTIPPIEGGTIHATPAKEAGISAVTPEVCRTNSVFPSNLKTEPGIVESNLSSVLPDIGMENEGSPIEKFKKSPMLFTSKEQKSPLLFGISSIESKLKRFEYQGSPAAKDSKIEGVNKFYKFHQTPVGGATSKSVTPAGGSTDTLLKPNVAGVKSELCLNVSGVKLGVITPQSDDIHMRATSPLLFDSEPMDIHDPSSSMANISSINIPETKDQDPSASRQVKRLFRVKTEEEEEEKASIVEKSQVVPEVKLEKSEPTDNSAHQSDEHDPSKATAVLNTKRARKRRKVCRSSDQEEEECPLLGWAETRDSTEDIKQRKQEYNCHKCGTNIANTGDIKTLGYIPKFLEPLVPKPRGRQRRQKQDVFVVDGVHLVSSVGALSGPGPQGAEHVQLNSHWDGDLGCCIQYIICPSCSTTGPKEKLPAIGAKVMATTATTIKDQEELKPGQVLLLSCCVTCKPASQ